MQGWKEGRKEGRRKRRRRYFDAENGHLVNAQKIYSPF